MIRQTIQVPPSLFELDETAWLEAMAELIEEGRLDELDYVHLREYLTDMARRDRREVESRLTILLAHLLKWACLPQRRSRGWRATVMLQQQELAGDAADGVLRHHAEAALSKCHARAVKLASA